MASSTQSLLHLQLRLHRYPAAMTRQCMRPDCDRQASACLTYDADTSEVWLQDPRDDDEPAQLVCSLHAGSLTAPLGWTITDRRSSEVPAPDPVPAPEPQPVRESEPVPARSPVAASEPEPERVDGQETVPAAPAEPTTEPNSDPATEAEPVRRKPKKNSLLDRAFEWTGPQHSVLTTETPAPAEDKAPPGD